MDIFCSWHIDNSPSAPQCTRPLLLLPGNWLHLVFCKSILSRYCVVSILILSTLFLVTTSIKKLTLVVNFYCLTFFFLSTIAIWIALISINTVTRRQMISNKTFGILPTGTRTWAFTFLINTCPVRRAVGIKHSGRHPS